MKEHFEKFLGLGNATENPADLLAYGYDGSELSGPARVVVFPKEDEQVRLILSFCNRSNIDVIIRGNGSNRTGMTIPNNSVVLSTLAFDRVLALNIQEEWVHVECGVTIAQLNEALETHGVRFVLDPASRTQTTVGSFLACNGASRHSTKYGRVVQNVVELEIIDGSGKLFTVTKDFDQYLGLEGSTFMIIRAKLKVQTISERSADTMFFDTLPELITKAQELLAAPEKPLSIDFFDAPSAAYAGFNTKHMLFVEWDGARGALRHENYAAFVAKREHTRHALGHQGYTLMDDGQVVPEYLERAIAWCATHDVPVFGHAGLGILHPCFTREQEKAGLRMRWWEWLSENGQRVNGQFGYGTLKKKYVPASLKSRVRQLKERHDYNNTFGRGKLYDYI